MLIVMVGVFLMGVFLVVGVYVIVVVSLRFRNSSFMI